MAIVRFESIRTETDARSGITRRLENRVEFEGTAREIIPLFNSVSEKFLLPGIQMSPALEQAKQHLLGYE